VAIIVHFRFHIHCISIHKLLYFNFFSAYLLLLLMDIQNYLASCDGLPQYPRATPRPLTWSFLCSWKKSSPNINYRIAANWLYYTVVGFWYSSTSSASDRTSQRTHSQFKKSIYSALENVLRSLQSPWTCAVTI
jgi:hypothetical protein